MSTPQKYIKERLDWAQRCFDATLGTNATNGPGTVAWDRAITGLVCGWQQAALMEMLRLVAPAVADRFCIEIVEHLDDGSVIGELLHEWREDIAAGRAISARKGYLSIFDTARLGAE